MYEHTADTEMEMCKCNQCTVLLGSLLAWALFVLGTGGKQFTG